jgi:hypothetical protein
MGWYIPRNPSSLLTSCSSVQHDTSVSESIELEPEKTRERRPVEGASDHHLDLQSLHVLADSAVLSHLYRQWRPKEDVSKTEA